MVLTMSVLSNFVLILMYLKMLRIRKIKCTMPFLKGGWSPIKAVFIISIVSLLWTNYQDERTSNLIEC